MAHPALLSRRALVRSGLAAGTVVLAAACESADKTRHRSAGSVDDEDPDVALLTEAIQDEAALLGLAKATGQRHATLAGAVQPILSRQRAHVRAMAGSLSEPPTVQRGRPDKVSATPAKALAALGDAASDAEAARLDDCLAATSGLLARLFASASASHATSVETLRQVR